MSISGLADKLLEAHAKDPDRIFYHAWIFGNMVRSSEVQALDAAYAELEREGYMTSAHAFTTFQGRPKTLYRVTEKGLNHAAQMVGTRN